MAHDLEIPPFSAALFFNGWLAGFVNPREGCMAAGEAANEETLRAALVAALEQA